MVILCLEVRELHSLYIYIPFCVVVLFILYSYMSSIPFYLQKVICVHTVIWLSSHHHLVVPSAWISLTLSRHPSLSFIASGRSSGYTPYPHRAAVCRFELVALLLLGHVKGSILVHHLWAHPCFSSSVLHFWFV